MIGGCHFVEFPLSSGKEERKTLAPREEPKVMGVVVDAYADRMVHAKRSLRWHILY